MKQNIKSAGMKLFWRGGALLASLTLAAVFLSGLSSVPKETPTGWGNEVLSAVQEGAASISPIRLANACGMGASSCFKCHNGQRAKAANMDAAKAPWHAQHKKVNNSCVGCHKGNPRIMKEDLSHKGMIADARNDAGGSCAGCHSADMAKVKDAYQSVRREGK